MKNENYTELEHLADMKALNLMDEIEDDMSVGVEALFEYLADYSSGKIEDEDFMEDWRSIVSAAYHAPWSARHKPLNRQVDKAIDHIALKIAKELLK
jgi:hypothetical protein